MKKIGIIILILIIIALAGGLGYTYYKYNELKKDNLSTKEQIDKSESKQEQVDESQPNIIDSDSMFKEYLKNMEKNRKYKELDSDEEYNIYLNEDGTLSVDDGTNDKKIANVKDMIDIFYVGEYSQGIVGYFFALNKDGNIYMIGNNNNHLEEYTKISEYLKDSYKPQKLEGIKNITRIDSFGSCDEIGCWTEVLFIDIDGNSISFEDVAAKNDLYDAV